MANEECLLEEVSPNGSVEAILEQDGRAAHFYLRGAPDTDFGFKSCWVRNLKPAPQTLDVGCMKEGRAPMQPASSCNHPMGMAPLDKGGLRIVWFEESDGAALLEDDEILAVIPSWSGQGGFHGYARDCTSESNLSWPFEKDNVLRGRIERAENYWKSWEQGGGPWPFVQESQCEAYVRQLGQYQKYYAIDGGDWPPKAMLRIEQQEAVLQVTIGVCLRAQPAVEQVSDRPENLRRIELGAAFARQMADRHFMSFAQYISAQSNLPWARITWLGPYHTIPCDAFGPDSQFSAVLLVPQADELPAIKLPEFREDPVNLLWMLPITESERIFAVDKGGEALLEKLKQAGYGVVGQERSSVV